MLEPCWVYRLGMVPYQQAWSLQERLAAQVAAGEHPPALLLLQHPHTYTFGRRGQAKNLLWGAAELEQRGIEVVWADRGGDVTYHGPGQLVGYPLLPLAPGGLFAGHIDRFSLEKTEETGTGRLHAASESEGVRLPGADYVGYLRRLEDALIAALFGLGLAAGQLPGMTGVWVQPDVLSRCRNCAPELRRRPAKIAAIGVKVDARGISRHGFALNVDPDMRYWDGIVACGLEDYSAVSLAELLQPAPGMERVERAVIAAFGSVFGYEMVIR